ncbi:silent information regulator family protein [Pelomyxa schiedti]|nr:silent information regulator family protein [Pelomyxa schiedti]
MQQPLLEHEAVPSNATSATPPATNTDVGVVTKEISDTPGTNTATPAVRGEGPEDPAKLTASETTQSTAVSATTSSTSASAEEVAVPLHSANIPKSVLSYGNLHDTSFVLDKLRSHLVVLVVDCVNCKILLRMNQRLSMILFVRCRNCVIKLLDSAVVTSRTCRIVDCSKCDFVFEDIDTRKVEVFGTNTCKFIFIGDTVLLESQLVIWRKGCTNNTIGIAEITSCRTIDVQYECEMTIPAPNCCGESQWVSNIDTARSIHHTLLRDYAGAFEQPGLAAINAVLPFIKASLPRDETHHNSATSTVTGSDIIADITELAAVPPLPQAVIDHAYDEERREYLEPLASLQEKAAHVAQLLRASKHTVVYSGAGISTSSGIGDFRGPKGLWTCSDKGTKCESKTYTDVLPTFAHYAITALAKKKLVHFVVTTNVDGLHLRSGTPLHMLVELHGCCYKEVCTNCKKVFLRDYNVFRGKNTRSGHLTGRMCDFCRSPLVETSVAFGETYRDPVDAIRSAYHARKATLAIVLGTSMNVQGAASYPEKALRNQGGSMILVNMQATPYESIIGTRVWARIDDFMRLVMENLGITVSCECDMLSEWAGKWSD